MKKIFNPLSELGHFFLSPSVTNWNILTPLKIYNFVLFQREHFNPPKNKGKYCGQNFQFFPSSQTKTCQFLPCFLLPTLVQIFIASWKWREIHSKTGKISMNYRNVDRLSFFCSNWISSLFFSKLNFRGRGAFGQNIYPCQCNIFHTLHIT